MGDAYAAEDHMVAFAEGVRVHAESDALGGQEVLRIGEFSVLALARHDAGRRDVLRVDAALVGEGEPFGTRLFVGGEQLVPVKSLRGLHEERRFPRRHREDVPVRRQRYGIRRRDRAHAAAVLFYAFDAGADRLVRDEGARRVVHEHDVALRAAERIVHRFPARAAAAHGAGGGEGGEQRLYARLVRLAARHDDLVRACRGECGERPREYGQSAQFVQYLVFRKSRARAFARGADDGGYHTITS